MIKELDKYQAVNKCQTLDQLAEVILDISEHGIIYGMTDGFDAQFMSLMCRDFNMTRRTILTRRYGIRQQAIMIWIQSAESIDLTKRN